MAKEQDILRMPAPRTPPRHTSRRIGIHTSTAGGPATAAERAYRLGCNTFQIFSSSPRQWKPYELGAPQCAEMWRLREKYGLKPLVIHSNYLVNLGGGKMDFYARSVAAFRGEVERAAALGADYLVLHPGSFRGLSGREEGLNRVAAGIATAVESVPQHDQLTVLIENTAGSEFSLGSSFEQVAEIIARLTGLIRVAACIDTCHTHVAGYDIVSPEGYEQTMQLLDNTVGLRNVRVWHCNDAKAARGSRLDRHQHVGKGTIGLPAFRRLLNDPRTAHAAFIAETPVDAPGDDRRNVETLKKLVSDKATLSSVPNPRHRPGRPRR